MKYLHEYRDPEPVRYAARRGDHCTVKGGPVCGFIFIRCGVPLALL